MYTLLILNNLNLLFLLMSLLGTSISISSMNWFSAWMGLELNMISFVPLMINNKNIISSEASMKYFLIQASASSIFIFICIFNSYYNFMYFFFYSMNMNFMIIPLLMKLGASPFHNWFVMVMQGLDWNMSYLLVTLQKITPLFLLNFLFQSSNIILMFALLTSLIGSIGGLNQTSLNKIIAFSSINHLGWMLTTCILNKFMMMLYLMFYFLLNLFVFQFLFNKTIYNFNQIILFKNNLNWSVSILSLAGLPPFIGFLPKWMIIQMLIYNQMYMSSTILISSALITLIFYLRLIISNLIFSSSIQKWNIFLYMNMIYKSKNFLETIFMMISLMGLILYNLFLT